MNKFVWLLGCAPLLLAGCDEMATTGGGPSNQFIGTLSPDLLAIADPRQNLNAVKIDPVDGCFVYQYQGPVETTFLPLRSTEGRPICSQRPAAAQTAAADAPADEA